MIMDEMVVLWVSLLKHPRQMQRSLKLNLHGKHGYGLRKSKMNNLDSVACLITYLFYAVVCTNEKMANIVQLYTYILPEPLVPHGVDGFIRCIRHEYITITFAIRTDIIFWVNYSAPKKLPPAARCAT